MKRQVYPIPSGLVQLAAHTVERLLVALSSEAILPNAAKYRSP